MEQEKLNKIEANDTIKLYDANEVVDTGKKKFNFMGKECFIIHPTVNQEVELKQEYAKMFSGFLTKGDFLCRHQMIKLLKDKGIWTDQDKADAEELHERMVQYYSEFNSIPYDKRLGNTEFDKAYDLYAKTSVNYYTKTSIYSESMSNTVEGLCDQALLSKRLAMCLVNEKNEPITSEKEIGEMRKGNDLADVLFRAKMFWDGVEDRFLGN